MALGYLRAAVAWLVLRETAALILAGTSLRLTAAIAAARLIARCSLA